jgi:flagellar protein FliO/FliZ
MLQLQMLLGENGTKFLLWAALGIAALIAVLFLILVVRRLFGSSFNMNGAGDRRNRPPRLGVTDFFNLDRQGRRLVIVRRDNVEHLVLIGGPNDLLIEQNIIRGLRPELPIVETTTRPTVSSKITDDEGSVRTEQEQRVKNSMPESQTAPKLNIPKLNIPNLDLRTSTSAATPSVQKPVAATIEPIKIELPKPNLTPSIPKATALPEKPVESKLPTPVVQAPTVKELETPIAPPAKKPLSTAFGDAAKRLEEALRRPIDASPPKPADLKIEAPKPVPAPAISTPKPVETKKLEPAPAVEQKPDAATNTPAQAPEPLTSGNLVLDLEQEMARLLGRTPGKGL